MRKLRFRGTEEDTQGIQIGGLGPRLEPRHSDCIPTLPLPPGVSGSIRQPSPHPQRPWGGSAWKAPKQNMRLGFSIRSQGLLLSREKAPWTTSALFSGTASWLAKDPPRGLLFSPHTHHPRKESPSGICACPSLEDAVMFCLGCAPHQQTSLPLAREPPAHRTEK